MEGMGREGKEELLAFQSKEWKRLNLSLILHGGISWGSKFFFLAAISRMLRRGQMRKSSEESTIVLKVSWIQHRLLSLSTYNLCFSKVCMALG